LARGVFVGFALAGLGLAQTRGDEPATPAAKADPAVEEFFERQIRPLLAERCGKCHGAEKQKGGLRVDTAAGFQQGGESGKLVVNNNPDASPLIAAVRYAEDPKMPPDGKLPTEAIAALEQWVRMGAPWPAGNAPATPTSNPTASAEAAGPAWRHHWAFQPVVEPPLPADNPAAATAGFEQSPVDRFVYAELAKRGITPSAPADRRALIRRVSYDLLGLPPRPEEVEAFVADSTPDAYPRLVDRLLASPQYGERWARHWLDVARYADTRGYLAGSEDRRYPYAYTYRDWVVDALNRDMPYDQFLIDQLAADCLPQPQDKANLAALGFLTVGRRFLNVQADIIDDRIDVIARGTMGLTVACARCHDHKFDPIPTADYYSLYGVFASTEERLIEIEAPNEEYTKELKKREHDIEVYLTQERDGLVSRERQRAGEYLLAAHESRGGAKPKTSRVGEAQGDLNSRVYRGWREFLDRVVKKPFDPVFGPWFAFVQLPTERFTDDAALLSAHYIDQTNGANRVNRRLAEALAAKPPASLKDAAALYGSLLSQADSDWRKSLADASAANAPAPVRLPDDAAEELRMAQYAAGSPTDISIDQFRRMLNQGQSNHFNQLNGKIAELRSTPIAPKSAMAMADAAAPRNAHVFLRGNPGAQGPEVPRQFLLCLSSDQRRPFEHGSGRLDLAQSIASPQNPLTARVFVNRVWQHHFGVGLVRTTSDFGVRTDRPSHPELLDYLAAKFVQSGWSIKTLQRQLVLSATYQQASQDRPECREADPENRLLWRMNRQRLDWEEVRDSLLAAAGQLDAKMGGPSIDLTAQPFSNRRTIYGLVDRQNLPGVFRAFDMASPDTHTPQRFVTTVPQQSLFMFNSPFVVEKAKQFVARPEVAAAEDPAERIRRLYALAFGRVANEDEVSLGLQFVAPSASSVAAGAPPAGKLDAWQIYAQALLLTNEFFFID
jgi:cytochrome c553